ncbi:MAG TPA: thioredoxin domain-containing protein, partial [Gemmataceae bacterium]|nr:thioredoxin domain-containing protein [Gemmataceae bacterium]
MVSQSRRTFAVLLLALPLALTPTVAGPPKGKDDKPRFTNRLAKETSPYLLMHAHNPVDWYPWGPEAFAKAKKEGKLIFLSIGYSSCYWCHVMERESFANEEVAKLMNQWFVAIKVDREERPDIDQIYMTALTEVQQGRGGWPLSMFLTAEGKPIVGGTYWPREDKEIDGETQRGFKTILKLMNKFWTDDPKGISKQAESLAAATVKALESNAPGLALIDLDRTLAEGGIEPLTEGFDPVHGGFGVPTRGFRGPKFPTPARLEYLLQVGQRKKSDELIKMVTLTLDKMALGGIYDHLGGGFHRYSTERTWTVPHFEKMLYDNAQLAELYARAYRLTKSPLYRRVLDETLGYVMREMMTKDGGFYSSQDAETHHEEGRFYVWTGKELDEALPDKADNRFFRKVYGADDKPNFEEKYHILTLPKPLSEVAKDLKLTGEQLEARLASLRQKVFEVRGKRDRPFRNEVMLTAWSGQMIAGYAEAGRALGEKKYLDTASRAAEFVLKHQRTADGRLLRAYGGQPGKAPKAQGNGYLEDY